MVAAGRLGTVVKLAWKKAGKLTSLGASRRGTRGVARARLKEKVKEKGLVNKNHDFFYQYLTCFKYLCGRVFVDRTLMNFVDFLRKINESYRFSITLNIQFWSLIIA